MSERQSHDASRASSPPPSIVGSAPERVKSKNQQKKDRREKARKTTGAHETASAVSTTPVAEEVAPVIARQKKQKKRVETSTVPSTEDAKLNGKFNDTNEAAPVKPEEVIQKHGPEGAGPQMISKVQEKENVNAGSGRTDKSKMQPQKTQTPLPETSKAEPVPNVEDVQMPYTLRDLYNEAGKMSRNAETTSAIQKLLNEHISSMPKIIASMIQSGDLSKDHPWLNPPNFNSAAYKLGPDSRRGQEYLDGNGYSANDAFGYIYLPLREKQALKDGNAVSVADAGDRKDDLLKRCLVTPNGWVLRHLSAEESEKVLELEERRQMYVEEFGDVGSMEGLGVLEADDYTNLGGGMERLARQGERHGVVWIVGEGEQMGEDGEFEPFDDDDAELDGEVGASDDEEEPDEEGPDGVDGDDLDDRVNMPGAWDLPPPNPPRGTRANTGRVNSLPGLGPYSKTNALRSPARGPAIGPESLALNRLSAPSTSNTDPNGNADTNVNLRALDTESLQRRVAEKQKELEAARKEMEKIEKMWNKKSKDINRWREGLVAKG